MSELWSGASGMLEEAMQRSKLFYATVVFVGTAASIFGKTLTVNSAADAGGSCPGADCTLHQAIATAASGDTINFAPAITTINLTSGELLITTNDLTINGPGANLLNVQRSAPAGHFRIFAIASGSNVIISGLTIAKGSGDPVSTATAFTTRAR
jgi:hypothetical protein